jgi:hypothetical protein
MTTARALLRRLIFHGRIDPQVPSAGAAPEKQVVEHRLESARQRLKQTIPPPEEPGQTTPSPEGVSPGQESPSVP